MDRETRIRKALEGVETGKYKSLRAAGRDNGIAHTTLLHRRNGGQSYWDSHEYQQACNKAEEEALVDWVLSWHFRGFPVRPEELREMAGYLILNRANSSRRETISTHLTGINWPARFIARHPQLAGLIAEPLEKPRYDACTPNIFNNWFSRYKEHFDRYKPDPRNIYNIDETGFILGKGEKAYVIVEKQSGSSSYRIKAKKGKLLTAIECVSATGMTIAPMIIYKGEYLQHHWFEPSAPRD
jgi:hypothetical protein